MRDVGATNPIQMLENKGVSLTEKKATDAVALSQLSDPIFRDVTLGRFTENRAVIVGRELGDNKPGQDAIYQSVKELEDKGQEISDKKLTELIRVTKGAGNYTENQTDLFGTRALEKSYAPQMADVLAYTRGELGKEKRVFGTAEKNAARLEQGGSSINTEQAVIQQGASTRGDLLDRFAYKSGTNANAAIRKYAELLANSPKSARPGVLKDALQGHL
jgi:hypothetical protein